MLAKPASDTEVLPQLIGMEADPGEIVNLAVEARHHDTLEAHRRLLHEWMIETDDSFWEHYAHPGAPPLLPGRDYERPSPAPGS